MRIPTYFIVLILISTTLIFGQKKKKDNKKESIASIKFNNLNWRNIGPFRGGRSVASSGVLKNPSTFYMGSTGGGVWKTEDYGTHWKNISDGFFATGTVGAISVSESDPNIVIVGMGEHAARGVMTSMGDGVYKSEDAGVTWKHIGLNYSRHISDIQIHPTNPDIFYVAVQGAQYGPSKERGIYKTLDGGKTWIKSLFVGEFSGASSLSMDMNNPRTLYAAIWDHERTPWQMRSGGSNSGIYKSSDGGEKWIRLEKGLPKIIGKSGISVSRANPSIVYINLEGEEEKSGVYRSDNSGETWKQVNKNRIAVTRSWYYMEVFADPQDENVVYVLNAPALKSIDKGETFKKLSTPHGDNHHLWIHPYNNKLMINSNDGGANVSLNGGKSWSTQQNQPTAQFYRVIADAQVPYHVYGGQQDNSAIGIKSRDSDSGIDWKDWYSVAGCESAFLAFDPYNPEVIFGGCYQGIIERWHRSSNSGKGIKEYPELSLGNIPKDFKFRYNWNAPILRAPSDPNTIYHAGNVVFKTKDGGNKWEVISPDLTRNNKSQQIPGGTPFTNEAAGGENYNTLMSLATSPHDSAVLWAGSDDGLIHITKDGGKNWKNVTPRNLKEGIINSIEVSPHKSGKAYITMMRYKFMDLTPYVYKTEDYGKSWKLITDGIKGEHNFVRVVRADKKIPGLLYAGSETGFYISHNDGDRWDLFQNNLPIVPINDLFIQDNDLIAATAGRSFWILDDLSPIQEQKMVSDLYLITPKANYRIFSGKTSKNSNQGTNPLNGVIFDYHLPKAEDSLEVSLEIFSNEKLIRSYNSKKTTKIKSWPGGPDPEQILPKKEGFNRFHWDLRREPLPSVDNVFVYGSYLGTRVAPGDYKARLKFNGLEREVLFSVLPNPNMPYKISDFEEQQNLLTEIEIGIKNIHQTVTKMRKVQKQLSNYREILKDNFSYETLLKKAEGIEQKLKDWEQNLIQPKQKTFQDVINFNNKLNAQWMYLKDFVDSEHPKVTQGALERYKDLQNEWFIQRTSLENIIEIDFKSFENEFKSAKVPALVF